MGTASSDQCREHTSSRAQSSGQVTVVLSTTAVTVELNLQSKAEPQGLRGAHSGTQHGRCSSGLRTLIRKVLAAGLFRGEEARQAVPAAVAVLAEVAYGAPKSSPDTLHPTFPQQDPGPTEAAAVLTGRSEGPTHPMPLPASSTCPRGQLQRHMQAAVERLQCGHEPRVFLPGLYWSTFLPA